MEGQKKHSKRKIALIIIVLITLIIISISYFLLFRNKNNDIGQNNNDIEEKKNLVISKGICDFDFLFLKKENTNKNIIYSPLSVKYALKKMEEISNGNTKEQISKYIGNYELPKYNSNEKISIINCILAKDELEQKLKNETLEDLKIKYNVEVLFDSLKDKNSLNTLLKNKTFGLIENMIKDEDLNNELEMINSIIIDMEWEDKFLFPIGTDCEYKHEKVKWAPPTFVTSNSFGSEKKNVSGMTINASINNYDIVKDLGEKKIRQTVESEYRKWLENHLDNKTEEDIKQFIDNYIEEIKSNYHREDCFSNFEFYTDENVKVFAKDLKEYDGVKLQYIGVMPTKESLDSYIKIISKSKLNHIITNLKSIKHENFDEGVVTLITGFIPKFKFDYELNLTKDLKDIGIEDIFESERSDLTKITDDNTIFLNESKHKNVIEFSEDGIMKGTKVENQGRGGFINFEYNYDVPIKNVDLTFDKPYMFIIRDKETEEIWYIGAVYEPMEWKNPNGELKYSK